MKRAYRRTKALLLSMCMIFSLLPTAALADGSAAAKTLPDAQMAGVVTDQPSPGYALLGSAVTWNGDYTASTATLTDVIVTGDTTVYIPEGETLTIEGSDGTVEYGSLNSNTGTSTASPSDHCGKNAITITSGTLTFTGPGELIVTGGLGKEGKDEAVPNSEREDNGGGGGRGGDGVYIAAGATLKFDRTFTGKATISGGAGGMGGTGKAASEVTASGVITGSAARGNYSVDGGESVNSRGGNGGEGGDAGYGIGNNGTVIFNQDSANDTLAADGTYTTGSVNVKGGVGGIGGTAGGLNSATDITLNTAGEATYENTPSQAETEAEESAEANALAAVPENATPGKNDAVLASWTANESETNGSHSMNYSEYGNGGLGGASGYGIHGGIIKFESGITGIEGGNNDISSYAGVTLTEQHITYDNGSVSTTSTAYYTIEEGIEPAEGNTGAIDGDSVGGSEQKTWVLTYAKEGSTDPVDANFAIAEAAVYNNGGTSFAVFGNDGNDTALKDCTVTAETDVNQTGSFYEGNGSAATSSTSSGNATADVRVKYLEGYNHFAAHSKNFYVMNAGDTYPDRTWHHQRLRRREIWAGRLYHARAVLRYGSAFCHAG